MNKLGSEFHKEINGFERGVIGGVTFRQLVMMLGLILGVGLSMLVIVLGLPDILMYLALIVVIPPFAIYGLKKDEQIKEYLKFQFTLQERSYMTELESEETSGFIQEKGVTEWLSENLNT